MTAHDHPLKAAFVERHGRWGAELEGMLELDAGFLEAYLDVAGAARGDGPLPPKAQELILLAASAAATHLHEPAIRAHTRAALEHGASAEEILEVLEATSVLGIHSCRVAVPMLLEALDDDDLGPLTERQAAIRSRLTGAGRSWTPMWDGMMRFRPDFLEAYLRFSEHPSRSGVLEPQLRELVYVAVDASTTHLYEPGIAIHVRAALRYGATAEQVMQVLALVFLVGLHTCEVGVPVLLEELAARQRV